MDVEETRRKYKDIIDKERPVHDNDQFSADHPKMDLMERAKIFAPFSALRGLNKSLSARIKVSAPTNDLTPEREEEINQLLYSLNHGDVVTIIYRLPYLDENGKGCFNYEQITGAVGKIKKEEGYILIINERIPLNSIYDIKLA